MFRHRLITAANLLLVLAAFSWCADLCAQGEISVRRLTSPAADVANNATDTIIDVETGVYTGIVWRISNSASSTLTLGTVTLSAFNNCAPTVQSQPLASLAATSSDTFMIWVFSNQAGPFSFVVTIPNSDFDESPFSYTVTGNIVSPPNGQQAPAGTTRVGGGGGGACVAARSGSRAASVLCFGALLLPLALLRRRAGRA